MHKIYLAGIASTCLLAASMPSTTFGQEQRAISSTNVAPTCRSALDIGGTITEVDGVAAPPCCYVIQEQDWYDANNIRLSATYQREDGETYLTEPCELLSDNQLGAGAETGGGVAEGTAGAGAQPAEMVGGSLGANAGQPPENQNGAGGGVAQPNSGAAVGSSGTGSSGGSANIGGTANNGNGNAFAGNGNAGQGNAFAGSGNAGQGNAGQGGGQPGEIGNPGNRKDVGRAGEAPNGDTAGFKPQPGEKGKSD
ncbi:hypothetical protein [Devosia sp. RR2S18]|uniref:hypothetical protein n=1 Tax=Devosia rhizosphaerae TaxID=3049774 RepID=UPI00254219E5|nr:hypothetical protein [Devosia sp. RR2S18]WIJ26572.1 hypothetical protein QOV41_07400 [Devosia sp. RR2S18]